MKESFVSKIPNSEFLRQHISYYYFHKSGVNEAVKSFIYYPHFRNALSVYKNSVMSNNGNFNTFSKPAGEGYSFGYTKLISHAAKATIHPPFNKIGVVFQPIRVK